MQGFDLPLAFAEVKLAASNVGIVTRSNLLQILIELGPAVEHAQAGGGNHESRLIEGRSPEAWNDRTIDKTANSVAQRGWPEKRQKNERAGLHAVIAKRVGETIGSTRQVKKACAWPYPRARPLRWSYSRQSGPRLPQLCRA